jgi:hypothetical protein
LGRHLATAAACAFAAFARAYISATIAIRYRQQQQQPHHPFQLQTPQQHPVQVEYAFTHPESCEVL